MLWGITDKKDLGKVRNHIHHNIYCANALNGAEDMGRVVALRQELDSFYTESQYGQGQVLSQQSFKLEVHR